jgi:N4-gp56 family major capsid protein
MTDILKKFFYTLLLLLACQAGTSVTAMAPMNSDSDSDLDSAVPEIWEKRLRLDASRKSFWGNLKGGEGSEKPIIEKEDFVNQKGDVIHINVVSELYGPGVEGESTARGNEDKLATASFSVTVNWLRKVVGLTKKVKKEVMFDAVQLTRTAISNWLARELDRNTFVQLLDNTTDTLYAGNATSAATLGDDDTFTTQELDKIKLALDRKGAIPLSVDRKNGQETYHYGVVISEVDEYNLRGDDRWLEAVQTAQASGENNPIFSGRPVEWNGLLVYTLRGVKAAGCIQGTPLRPECSVYTDGAATDLTSVATTILIGGVANANTGQQKQYTQFFASTGTIKIDSEEITYSGKTYRSFTGCTRGANGTTAAAHAEGSLVTQRNVSKIIGFGAEICAFAWGQHPQRIEDTDDYGFITGLGIETLYGVKAIEDSDGNKPNYLVMQAFSKNPGNT